MNYLPDTNIRCFVRVMHGQQASDQVILHVQQDLRLQVADIIVNKKLETTYKEDYTLYSLDLYVLTPDELASLIKKEADKLAYFWARNDSVRGR